MSDPPSDEHIENTIKSLIQDLRYKNILCWGLLNRTLTGLFKNIKDLRSEIEELKKKKDA